MRRMSGVMCHVLLHICVSVQGVAGAAIACDQTPRKDFRLRTCVGPCLGPGYIEADSHICAPCVGCGVITRESSVQYGDISHS